MSKRINATHYDHIPTFPSGEKHREPFVNAIVETPKGSDHKFQLMPEYGIIAYHHVLPGKLTWPYDYGFVPQTLAPDGDAVDILVITDDGLFRAASSKRVLSVRFCKPKTVSKTIGSSPCRSRVRAPRFAPIPTWTSMTFRRASSRRFAIF